MSADKAKRGGDAGSLPKAAQRERGASVRARWPEAEPAVWPERMLTALERGVNGGLTAFFTDHALFCLKQAHGSARQSSRRQYH